MEFVRTKIPDVVIIKPTVHGDERGYFSETFRLDLLQKFLNFKLEFCQDNESKSSRGVIRGLHYQLPSYAQSKLVRVVEGRVLDVAVDIRRGSPWFGQYVAVELSNKNKQQLFVPRGFAHGFVVLSDTAIFSYKVDNYYSFEHERGINYDDPDLDINWILETEELVLSPKDKDQSALKDAIHFDYHEQQYERINS